MVRNVQFVRHCSTKSATMTWNTRGLPLQNLTNVTTLIVKKIRNRLVFKELPIVRSFN